MKDEKGIALVDLSFIPETQDLRASVHSYTLSDRAVPGMRVIVPFRTSLNRVVVLVIAGKDEG